MSDEAPIPSPPRKAQAAGGRHSSKPTNKLPSGSGDSKKPARNYTGKVAKCLCGDPDCDSLMKRMAVVNPTRCHYFILPKPPKELKSAKKRKQEDIEKKL